MRKKVNKKNTGRLTGRNEVRKVGEDKKKEKVYSMADLFKDVEKEFKDDNPDIISDPKKIVQFVSSGVFVENLVSNGGWPRRRISEVFGMEHSGKSSLLYQSFAKLQKKKGVGILIDYEGSWEPTYARKTFGLIEDKKTFVVFQPDTVEEGDRLFEIINKLPRIDLFVIDSVDAMKPQALIECSLNKEARIGAHATAVGKVVAKMRRFARRKNCAVVFTNQVRAKINTQGIQNTGTGAGFNVMEPYTTPGGFAVRFYASLRLKLEFAAQQKDKLGVNAISGETEELRVGNLIKIINVKNKVGPPMRKYVAHYDFMNATSVGGWNEGKDIIYILKKRGRLSQVKGSMTYHGLDIPEWKHCGSKVECDKAFCDDPKLIEDGKKLILHLMEQNDLEVLDQVHTNELDPEDISYQNNMHPEYVKSDQSDEELDASEIQDDKEPIQDISL